MRLYCISKTENFLYESAEETVKNTINALKKACEQRDIPFLLNDELQEITNEDILYRVTMDEKSVDLEKKAMSMHPKTFYREGHIDAVSSALQLLKCGKKCNVIPSIMQPFSEDKVTELGEFPLVLKRLGKMHGAGVEKVHDYNEIQEMLEPEKTYILQKYFPHTKQGRLIVVGDKVIASHENVVVEDDFRSNAVPEKKRIRRVVNYSEEIQQAAVNATKFAGYLFGGVDILLDDSGNFAVAEVNSPCYFYRTQELTGVDIAGQMIDFLCNGRVN